MSFRIGLTPDLSDGKGGFAWGEIPIEILPSDSWNFLPQVGPNFSPKDVNEYEAICFAAPGVIPGSFPEPENSPLILARLGVGYDNIDLAELNRAGVALTITPDGSKQPVATAALTLILSTMHKINAKNKLLVSGNWKERLSAGLGSSLNGKTVGVIGYGNIASELFRLIQPFNCKHLAYDPWKTPEDGKSQNVHLVSLSELLINSDVVVVMAILTPETKHLIDLAKLTLMKPNSFLINISRGPIVKESDLVIALQEKIIAGAGLDVFEVEPLSVESELVGMDNVVATPHNLAWTDLLGYGMSKSAFESIMKISRGEIPHFVVNKEVLETPKFKDKMTKVLNGTK